eukprot:gene12485-12573_t
MAPYEINRRGLSRSFQITNIFPKLSVFENLRCGVLWSMGYKYTFLRFLSNLHDANERAKQLMEMIKLDKKRDTLAMNLTYAEQRALEIGITIAGGANVILLDEPTAGMSKTETSRFIHLIKEVTEGRTLLTVEHDMGVVFGLADKIAVVVYGEVIAFDTPDKVRANQRVQEAYLGSAIMGLVDWEGTLNWKGQDLNGRKAYEIAHLGVGYVPESRDVFPNLTISDRALVMGHGSIVFQGTPDSLRADNYIRKEWLEV